MRQGFRLVLVCSALAMTIAVPNAVLAGEVGKEAQAIKQVEQDWCTASVKADATALAALLSDDYTDVVMSGAIENKAQTLANLKTDKTTVCETDQLQVRVYGDSAVAIGRTKWVTPKYNMYYRFTDSYVRRDGRWIMVASQAGEIKK